MNKLYHISITFLFFLTVNISLSQVIMEFECNGTLISNIINDVNDDGVIDNCDIFASYANMCEEYIDYFIDPNFNCSDFNEDNDYEYDEDDDFGGEEDDNDNNWEDVFIFECNGEEIIIETIDNSDFVDYESYIDSILSNYDCEEWGDEDDDWNGEGDELDDNFGGEEDNNDNAWEDVFIFECNGEEIIIETIDNSDFVDYESYIDSILSNYDCEEWGDEDDDWNGEGEILWTDIDFILSDWENFDWDAVWEDLGLSTLVDWDNIPWDQIIEFNILVDDLIYYINSIISGGQPFSWNSFLASQGCYDDDLALQGGLAGLGININGCVDGIAYLLSAGYGCFDALNIPGLSLEPIMPAEVCCLTCEILYGCTNEWACNFDVTATIDDGSCDFSCIGCVDNGNQEWSPYPGQQACNYDAEITLNMTPELVNELGLDDTLMCEYESCAGCMDITACDYDPDASIPTECNDYGVVCFVSPCSISIGPDIEGAYCVDDYCEGCCALWYSLDGNLISNSCDISNDNPAIGVWDDYDNDQYVEITEDVIGFYSFLEDDFFNCWYYWSIEYIYIGNGVMQIQDPDYGPSEITAELLDNGNLQILDPEGEVISMSPLNTLPDLELCNTPTNEGCEDFLGQWSFIAPGTNLEFAWLELYESGGKLYFTEEDNDCLSLIMISYDSIEGSNECSLFIDAFGIGTPLATASLNDNGTISLISLDDPNFPETWTPTIFDSSTFDLCDYGCTDLSACNYDIEATEDDGSCEYINPGECDCLGTLESIWYMDWDNNGTGNANDGIIISCDQPDGYVDNNDALSIDDNIIIKELNCITNIMGQPINSLNNSSIMFYYYSDGSVNKKFIIK